MSRRCGDGELLEACLRVLERHREVASLRMLRELVRGEVECSFSSRRLLRVLALSGRASIRVSMRRGRHGSACPLCGGELRPLRALDLYMRHTVAGFRCSECGYRALRADRVPARYSFSLRQGVR